MATLEKPRPSPTVQLPRQRARRASVSSIASSSQPRLAPLGPAPSPCSILRPVDAIHLPSVPTHDPGAGSHSRLDAQQQPSSTEPLDRVEPEPLGLQSPGGYTSLLATMDDPLVRAAVSTDLHAQLVEPLLGDAHADLVEPGNTRTNEALIASLRQLSSAAASALLSLAESTLASLNQAPLQRHPSYHRLQPLLQQIDACLREAPSNVPSTSAAHSELVGSGDEAAVGADAAQARPPRHQRLALLQEELGQIPVDPVQADDVYLVTALCALIVALEHIKDGLPSVQGIGSRGMAISEGDQETDPRLNPGQATPQQPWPLCAPRVAGQSVLSDGSLGHFASEAQVKILDRLHALLTTIQASALCQDGPTSTSTSIHLPSISPAELRYITTTLSLPPSPLRVDFGQDLAANAVHDDALDAGQDLGAWKPLTELVAISKELVSRRRVSLTEQQDIVRHNELPGQNNGFVEQGALEADAKRASVVSIESGRATLARSIASVQGTHRTSLWSERSLPPSYGHESFEPSELQEKEAYTVKQPPLSSLPSYNDTKRLFLHRKSQEEKKGYFSVTSPAERQAELPQDKQAPTASTGYLTAAYAARTPQDLLMVQHSIERLYTAVPQLLDQRCSLSPEKLRNASLQRMMDRFAASPRFENQRAEPPSIRTRKVSDPTSNAASASRSALPLSSKHLAVAVGAEHQTRRLSAAAQLSLKFSVSNLANSLRRSSIADFKGKTKEKEADRSIPMKWSNSDGNERCVDADSFNELFDSVRRAQDMSLSEQRTELRTRSGRKPASLAAAASASEKSRASAEADDDTLFQLLNNQGGSRLVDQDATMTPRRVAKTLRRASQPELEVAVREAEDSKAGSHAAKIKAARPEAQLDASSSSEYRSGQADDGTGQQGIAGTATNASRTSFCESSAEAAANDSESRPFTETATSADAVPLARLHYILETQPSLNAVNAMVRLPTSGANSQKQSTLAYEVTVPSTTENIDTHAPATLRLSHASAASSLSVHITDLGLVPHAGTAQQSGDHFAFKLPAQRCGRSAAHRHLHASEPVTFPLSTDTLCAQKPSTLCCSTCTSVIADLGTTSRYRALPSQHWEELVDAWMCHGDQELNESVARGKEGLEEGRPVPREEAWVADLHLLLPASAARAQRVVWDREGPEPDTTPVRCATCSDVLGLLYRPSSAEAGTLKLYKHALALASDVDRLAQLVSAQMLELARAHAVHKFVLTEEESGQPRILIWLFQPSFHVVTNLLNGGNASPIHATKCLFRLLPAGSTGPLNRDESGGEGEGIEPLHLPASRCDKVHGLLFSSNAVYPPSRRTFGPWNVAWLARL
ncbi:hypothetical protein ACQY0O_005996 [Thecaphora frezii]